MLFGAFYIKWRHCTFEIVWELKKAFDTVSVVVAVVAVVVLATVAVRDIEQHQNLRRSYRIGQTSEFASFNF